MEENKKSTLNPDAPVFNPKFVETTSDIKKAFLLVQKNVNTFSKYPTGTSYKLFQTYKDFGMVTNIFSINVLRKKNIITSLDNKEKNSSMDFIDNYMDKINVDVDEMSGVKNTNKVTNDSQPTTSGTSAGRSLVEWKPERSTTASYKSSYSKEWVIEQLLNSQKVPRPQPLFKDYIDNSNHFWKPRIKEKLNCLTPLDFKIVYDNTGSPVGYENPYKPELMLYKPPAKFIEVRETKMPQTVDETKLTIVNSEEALDALIEHLSKSDEIAIDIEHHALRTYQGLTCLIQMTTDNGGDFLIDAIGIREHIYKLNKIFSDPNKLKVMHGACNDIIWLQRDFGVYVVGLFDTYEAAKTLNLPKLSLQYLLKSYCNVDTDKKYQTADWRIRPLDIHMIKYARLDTHYLLYIWRQLKTLLSTRSSKKVDLLQLVFENSRNICLKVYKKKLTHNTSHMKLYYSSERSFDKTQLEVLKSLYLWRDNKARQLDESVMYVLPDFLLLSLAENLPSDQFSLQKCCRSTPTIEKYKNEILNVIARCRKLHNETCLSKMSNVISNVTHDSKYNNLHDYTELTEMQCQNENIIKNLIKTVINNILQNKNFKGAVSVVNLKDQIFVPPYDRFNRYRTLAKLEEIKSIKNKKQEIENEHHSIQFKTIATIEKENGENVSEKINEPTSSADDLEIQKSSQICKVTDIGANIQRKRKIDQKNTTPESRSYDHKKNPYKYLAYEKFFTEETKAPKSFKKFKK